MLIIVILEIINCWDASPESYCNPWIISGKTITVVYVNAKTKQAPVKSLLWCSCYTMVKRLISPPQWTENVLHVHVKETNRWSCTKCPCFRGNVISDFKCLHITVDLYLTFNIINFIKLHLSNVRSQIEYKGINTAKYKQGPKNFMWFLHLYHIGCDSNLWPHCSVNLLLTKSAQLTRPYQTSSVAMSDINRQYSEKDCVTIKIKKKFTKYRHSTKFNDIIITNHLFVEYLGFFVLYQNTMVNNVWTHKMKPHPFKIVLYVISGIISDIKSRKLNNIEKYMSTTSDSMFDLYISNRE